MDVIEGRGPAPAFVLCAVRALPDTTYTYALMRGGDEHKGWGLDRHMMADLIDALNQNTRATGNWGKKAPKIPSYPRPKQLRSPVTGSSKTARKKKVTVAELWGRMKKAL